MPLMVAAYCDKRNAFKMLIQNGADPSLKDKGGFRRRSLTLLQKVEIHPLLTSCYHLVLSLVQGAIMVSLMTAADKDRQNAFEMLVQNGADRSSR